MVHLLTIKCFIQIQYTISDLSLGMRYIWFIVKCVAGFRNIRQWVILHISVTLSTPQQKAWWLKRAKDKALVETKKGLTKTKYDYSMRYSSNYLCFKVAEDDIAFKLAIFKLSLHLNDNTGFCSISQASKLFFWSLLAKNDFFCPILNKKNSHPPGWPIVGVVCRRSGPSAAKMQLKRRIRHGPVACG